MTRRAVPAIMLSAMLLVSCSSGQSVTNGGVVDDESNLSREAREGSIIADEDGETGKNAPDFDDVRDAEPADGSPGASDDNAGSEGSTTEPDGPVSSEATLPPSPTTTSPPTVADCESVPESCVDPGEDFSGEDLRSAVFFQRDVSGVNFTNTNLSDSDFSEAVAIGANFTRAVLTDAIIEGADLTGADFTNADLTDAFVVNTDLTRAIWSDTTCPDGSNSDQNGDTCIGTF